MSDRADDRNDAMVEAEEEPGSEPRPLGRRAMVFGAAAAGAGAVAAIVGGAGVASAATGDPVIAGESVTASNDTTVSTTAGNGLVGETSDGSMAGVLGHDTSGGGYGVRGESDAGTGVYGTSTTGTGVQGATSSDGQSAVNGTDTSTAGGSGVFGESANGAGVIGLSTAGYGLIGAGALAPLALLPAGSAGAPASGAHNLGEVYVDSAGVLYKCVTAGTPGLWAPLLSTIPLASPVRVIDSRVPTGGISGPISPGTTYTSSVITGGGSGIPAVAVAVVGTLTLVAGTSGGSLNGGFLAVFPGGTTWPGTSNVNGDTSHAIASGVTVGLGAGANAGKVSVYAGATGAPVHVLLDVAAYII
jgi:hypothetical protein